jgi:hypothetical protein
VKPSRPPGKANVQQDLFMNPSSSVAPTKSGWLSKKVLRVYLPCCLLFVPVGLVVGYLLFAMIQEHSQLRSVQEEIDSTDPGWRMADLEARRAGLPDDRNGALCVLATCDRLPRPLPNTEEWLDVEAVPFRVRYNEKQKEVLRAELHKDAAALTEARKLADLPRGRFPVQWTRTALDRKPPHVPLPLDVVWLIHADINLRLADGDYDGALVSCRAAWNAGRSFGDEPFLPSQKVRLSCRASTLLSLERVLAQGQPSPDALQALISALLDEDKEAIVLTGWRGERASLYDLMAAHRDGEIKNGMSFELSRSDVAVRTMQVMTQMIEIAKGPAAEQTPRLRDLAATVDSVKESQESTSDAMAKSTVNSLHGFRQVFLRQQARLRCAAVALAAESHRRTHHGRWPERLQDLSPGVLPDVLLDPFDGEALRYQVQTESVIIYSVGPDGVDDGGKIDEADPNACTDIGIRVWNVEHRALPPR